MQSPFAISLFTALLLSVNACKPHFSEAKVYQGLYKPGTSPNGVKSIETEGRPDVEPSMIALGIELFHDRSLNTVSAHSCVDCHPWDGSAEIVDGLKPPSLLNVVHRKTFGWTGEYESLRSAIEGCLSRRMRPSFESLAENDLYDEWSEGYEFDEAARTSLEMFLNARLAGNSPLDKFSVLGDVEALGNEAEAGFDLFRGKARCAQCHAGFLLSSDAFFNTGVGSNVLAEGRRKHTGSVSDQGTYRVPVLRDVARHPPYMHDGSLESLRDVVDFYNRGGLVNPNLDLGIAPLKLSDEECSHLVSFLEALNSEISELTRFVDIDSE